MEENVGSSTRTKVESVGSLLKNEKFKGEFTNALLAANAIYEQHHLITDQPPSEINSISLAMAEKISEVTMNLIKEFFISTEEELILSHESDSEQLFEECADDPALDPEYDPKDYEDPPPEYIPLEYKAKVVALAEAHPKWSLAALRKNGASRLKRKDYLQRWKEDVQSGGTRIDKLRSIDSQTFERFQEARSCFKQVTTRALQQWASAAAFPFLSDKFHFQASRAWVTVFKRRHKIRQRIIKNICTPNNTL